MSTHSDTQVSIRCKFDTFIDFLLTASGNVAQNGADCNAYVVANITTIINDPVKRLIDSR